MLRFPKSVSSTQKLQTWVDNKVDFINNELPTTYCKGYTLNKQERSFLAANIEQPSGLLAARNYYSKQSLELQEILDFNHAVRNFTDGTAWKQAGYHEKQDVIAAGVKYQIDKMIAFEQKSEIMMNKIDRIKTSVNKLLPKEKKDHKKQILRDPITFTIYREIMSALRPPRIQRISWARFRIISTVLYYTGMRLREAGNLTHQMILDLINNNSTVIFQSKTSKERRLYVCPEASIELKKLKPEFNEVFNSLTDKVYPFEGKDSTSLIKLINKFLKPYREKYNLNLRSHSYRVNYITQTLKFTSVQTVQSLVGHESIKSTLAYDRGQISKEKAMNILSQSLSSPVSSND